MGPATRYTFRRNTASVMRFDFFLFVRIFQRFGNLHPGTAYEIILNPIVDGVEQEPVTARTSTLLPPPKDIHVEDVTENSLSIIWTQPNEEIES